MLATNTALDFGFTIAAFVPLVLLWICGTTNGGLTTVWRVSLGLGAVAPLLILLFRTQMKEPQSYVKNKINYRKMPLAAHLQALRPALRRNQLRLVFVQLGHLPSWHLLVAHPLQDRTGQRPLPDVRMEHFAQLFLHHWYLCGRQCHPAARPEELLHARPRVPIGDRLWPRRRLCKPAEQRSRHRHPLRSLPGLWRVRAGNNLGLLASKAIAPTAVRGLFYGMAAAIGKIGAFSGSYAYGSITDGFSRYPGGDVLQFSGPSTSAAGSRSSPA